MIKDSDLKDQRGAIEAYFKDNPKKTLFLDVGHGSSHVTDGTLSLKSADLPKNISKLIITNTSHAVTTIGNFFLGGCRNLTSLDLRGLTNLDSIGHYFLSGCRSLTSLDLRGSSKVSHILIG